MVIKSLWLKSCQRHAKSSSSYSFLQLEIILVFRCHRLKSALLQLVGGEMHIFRFKFHSLGTQRCHSYHFVRKGFCTQQQGDFMPKPLKRFRHTCNFLISSYPWRIYYKSLKLSHNVSYSQCVFSQIINLVNTWSQSCHEIMKNEESHWLVIDCDARFVTGWNHKSN